MTVLAIKKYSYYTDLGIFLVQPPLAECLLCNLLLFLLAY